MKRNLQTDLVRFYSVNNELLRDTAGVCYTEEPFFYYLIRHTEGESGIILPDLNQVWPFTSLFPPKKY